MYRSPFNSPARRTTPFKQKGAWAAGYHTGEDWVCDNDPTVVSPANGIIQRNSFDSDGYGHYVILSTNDEQSILLGHLKEKSSLSAQSRVHSGDVIGTMGDSGNANGRHLHIELEGNVPWKYNDSLIKPSEQIDFDDFESVREEYFDMAKLWQNGSTKESVFSDSRLENEIGFLHPGEQCQCIGLYRDRFIVKYDVDNSDAVKVGFVEYSGGIK